MKLILFIFGFFLLSVKIDVTIVRLSYKDAILSKSIALGLQNELLPISKNDDKVLVAYKGAVTAITAKYEKDNKNKKEIFKDGISLIEYAISKESNNIEIRFVRLSVQQNSPKFLKYNNNLSEDKNFILNNIQDTPNLELKNYLREYILQSKYFTEEEKNVISQI